VPRRPRLARLVPAERADLLRGDVPRFTARPGSRTLGGVARLLPEPGMALVQRRLRGLDEASLERQLWVARASVASLAAGRERERWPVPGPSVPRTPGPPGRDRLLAAALAVGERLGEMAVRGEDDASWAGLVVADERHRAPRPLGPDLYDGLPGVVLFLAHLGARTGREEHTALARAGLTAARRLLDGPAGAPGSIGGFSGWGGLVHVLADLGALWHRADLLDEARELAARLPALVDEDEQLDVAGGAAGFVLGLLSLNRRAPSRRALRAAVRAGDRLLDRARPAGPGIGWVTASSDVPPTGLAHGAAGIALALLELADATGEERFRRAAAGAVAFERSVFRAAEGSWPGGGMAWCHGPPGIALARLAHPPDAAARAEAETALATTVAHGFGRSHALCHGDLGNLEPLLVASRTVDGRRWRAELDRLAGAVLDGIEREGWLCATPLGVETPGLMTGLAGIGYGLLRLAEPGLVPPVLTLGAGRRAGRFP
jgi:type 2 lantibiotic biosynthesis protein LanM